VSDDRALELWGRYLARESLTEEERGELLARLEADADFRREALSDLDLHGLLQSSRRVERDAASFAGLVGRYVAKEREATRFAMVVQSRIQETRTSDAQPRRARPRTRGWRSALGGVSPRFPWGPALAAGVFAAVVVFLAASALGPRVPDERRAPAPKAPREEPVAEESTREPRQPRQEERERRLPEPPKAVVPELPGRELKVEEPKRIPDEVRESERAPRVVAPPPAAPPARPEDAVKPPTEACVAIVRRVEGEAYLVVRGQKMRAAAGQDIGPGSGIETGRASGAVEIEYRDLTRLGIGMDAEVRDFQEARGKRLFVAKGTLRAEVVKQPAGQPIVFVTPHGEMTVLGTTLRITADAGQSRLEVEEGTVRLKRLPDGKGLDVRGGFYATTAALVPKPLEEIVLTAGRGKPVGSEWKQAPEDPAWEATSTIYKPGGTPGNWIYPPLTNRSYVEFRFFAAGGTPYHVWIRGLTPATGNRGDNDEVALMAVSGAFDPKCPFMGRYGGSGFVFTGFSSNPGYGWIGGTDEAKGAPSQAVIRFFRPGLQILRLYAVECPMRVDSIWLSTTQTTKPDPGERGGETRRK
jgi:hypothetical protein